MANVKYKSVDIAAKKVPYTPDSAGVLGNSVLIGGWVRNVFSAQDTLIGSNRRIVYQQGLEGGSDFFVSGFTAVTGSNQSQPTFDHNRIVGRGQFRLTPGNMLRARGIASWSGMTHYDKSPDDGFHSSGNTGELVISATFHANDGSTQDKQVFRISLPGPFGVSNSGTLDPNQIEGPFHTLSRFDSPVITPTDFFDSKETAALYSEDVEVDLDIALIGAPRLVHLSLTEQPMGMVFSGSAASGSSAHAYTANAQIPLKHPTPGPMESGFDGATFDEQRFGTHHLLDVTKNQVDKLGPMIMNWTSYVETFIDGTGKHTATLNQAAGNEALPVTASTLPGELMDLCSGEIPFEWGSHKPGWRMPQGPRQHRFNDRKMQFRGKANQMPCTARVYARVDPSGGGTGVIRFQTSKLSFYEMEITNTTYQWIEDDMVLECARAGDDGRLEGSNLQIGIGTRTSSAEVDVRYIQLHFNPEVNAGTGI